MKHPPESRSSDWSIIKLLDWTSSYFKTHTIDSPRATAEILLAHALQLDRIDLYLQHDRPLNRRELSAFKILIRRRIQREPVAYIVGSKGFWTMDFGVAPGVLIPRPDTECLVETVLFLLPTESPGGRARRILELGTGSGAVVLSIAAERPQNTFFATDRSLKAICQARRNALQNQLEHQVHFLAGDWFAPFDRRRMTFDIIFSNPPYIPTEQIPELQPEVSKFEPLLALDGSKDGLAAIRHLIDQARHYLIPGGYLLLEIGHDQHRSVRNIVERNGFYADVKFVEDYGGKKRVARIEKK